MRGRAFVFACLCAWARPLAAQMAPNLHWQTIPTQHFRVHFSPGLEPIARRAAGSAERAYGRLAQELHEPRGVIELVVADNQDVSNGFTTTFPTNRIVIFARPTVDATALKFLDDWIDLVVSHELAHVFHLDRTEGWWRVGQWIFGRNPFLFPAQYTPSWLAEGIAVYYESRLTGSGRIEGTEHGAIARAQALDGSLPRLNALSSSTLRFPLGLGSYAYGALLVDQLASKRGAGNMRRFIDVSAGRTIPYLLNRNARRAFGISFDSAWRLFSDSVNADARGMARTPANADLSSIGWFSQRLRWVGDTHLQYGANDGRDVNSLRDLAAGERAPRWIARRNSLDITSPLADGTRVFSQFEFTDPYSIRADLYREKDGQTTRLTYGARLMQPDAGSAGIVAVQLTPGASRLVRVQVADSGAAPTITPISGATPDTIWSEPRWSRDGTRIAASRWLRNGMSDIVVLDGNGHVLRSLGGAHAVTGTPSWAPGDSAIYFTSDRSGRSEVYRGWVATGRIERVASAASALYESEPSPNGQQLATLLLTGDGYHVLRMPVPTGPLPAADSTSVLAPSRMDTVVTSSAKAEPYSAWQSVLPHYWLPSIQQTSDGATHWGVITSGRDAVTRHQWDLTALYEPARGEFDGSANYTFSGFGNPVVGASVLQEWDRYSNIFRVSGKDTLRVGTVRRRRRFADLAVTAYRPRYRTNSSFTVGGELEFDDYASDPDNLFATLTTATKNRLKPHTYPSVFASASWSNARRPSRAISNEDGVQFSVTARQRWRADSAAGTRSTSVVGAATAYLALPFAGFAHQVIALRAAAAWASNASTSEFSAGGISGQVVSVIPGVTVGQGRRTFPVRGFPAGAQEGIRALGGSAEYRIPLALPSVGLGSLPVFLQRVSAVLFTDAATSWCPAGIANSPICPPAGIARNWMASVGGELHLDAAFDYDSPYRLRLGVAVPAAGRAYFGSGSVTAYFAVGVPF